VQSELKGVGGYKFGTNPALTKITSLDHEQIHILPGGIVITVLFKTGLIANA